MKTRPLNICGKTVSWVWCIVIITLAGSWASSIQAQSCIDAASLQQLSVENAVMLSIQNNQDLLLLTQAPVLSGTFEQIERGQFDPELFAEGQHSRRSTTEISRSTEEQFDAELWQTNGEVGVRQQTPIGTTVKATLSGERNNSNRTPVQYSSRLGLSVTQQLFRGFGLKANLASVHRAEMDTLASTHELQAFVASLVAEVETTYWQLVAATEEIAVVEKSLDVAMAKLRDAEERVAVGAMPKNDVAQAETEVAMRKQRLIDAKSEQTVLRIKLLQLISPQTMKQNASLDAATPIPSPSELKVDVDDSIALATKRRPELLEANTRLKQGALEVAVTRNGVLPRLELFIDLGKTGYADSFGGSFSALSDDTYDATAGIRFSHFLGNRAARAKRKNASLQKANAQQAVENLRGIIEYDVRIAYTELLRAYEQTQVTAEARTYAAQSVTSQQAKFEAGATPALAVIQAERDLLESEIAEVTARVEYQMAKIQFFLAEGSLLHRRGIEVEK